MQSKRWWVAVAAAVIVGGTSCDSGAPGLHGPDDAEGGHPDEGGGGSHPPLPEPVRFIVMGDTGEGNDAQRQVATAIRHACDDWGCDFVLLLGDNIYDDGVESVDDPQWQTKFEEPYAEIELPFYAVLGNHDYGGQLLLPVGGVGNEFWKGPLEVEYTQHSDRWVMPATHYSFVASNVGFVMIDTNSLVWGNVDHGDQTAWYPGAVAELHAAGVDWIIGGGHHPYRSNGSHGNAGAYESLEIGGAPVPNPVPELAGTRLQTFFERTLCGTVDMYVSGHDHNRQWLAEQDRFCGAELVVSGAGAKVTALRGRGNETYFEEDTMEGFLHVTVEGKTLTGRFVDRAGVVGYERSLTKQ